jgi:hypothetical protein
MKSRSLLVALVLVPSLAAAQRRGGGFGKTEGPNYDGPGANNPGLQLSNGDVENMSPLKLLIDKRKDLKLADDKVKQIKDLESKLKETVQPSFKALDSLRREMRNSGRGDEDRSRMMSARNHVMTVVTDIRTAYDASLKDALPLFDEEQQKKANEMLDKQRTESEDVLKEKLGGGRGGRRG